MDDNLPPLETQTEVEHFRPSSTKNIGALSILPVELLVEILHQTDLQTLPSFRCVNRRARELVGWLPQYKAITTHALNIIRGILRIDLGPWIACSKLYETLVTSDCENCGEFGGYLYLLTCTRVCFLCFTSSKKYLPIQITNIRRRFGLDLRTLKTLSQMKPISGFYSPEEHNVNDYFPALLDTESAFCAGLALRRSLEAMFAYVTNMLDAEDEKTRRCENSSRPGFQIPRVPPAIS